MEQEPASCSTLLFQAFYPCRLRRRGTRLSGNAPLPVLISNAADNFFRIIWGSFSVCQDGSAVCHLTDGNVGFILKESFGNQKPGKRKPYCSLTQRRNRMIRAGFSAPDWRNCDEGKDARGAGVLQWLGQMGLLVKMGKPFSVLIILLPICRDGRLLRRFP